ncbi:hypothetical protein QJQ45_015547 [Haematococcus lacustris]|nr:hypothetical protein QJQ45_015547 [Haematococcus lacustris]
MKVTPSNRAFSTPRPLLPNLNLVKLTLYANLLRGCSTQQYKPRQVRPGARMATPVSNGHTTLIKTKPRCENRRVLVTGGAGFVGSHLCDFLVSRGDYVICLDNFFTGSKENVAHLLDKPNFELVRHDVVEPISLEVDMIFHLACPASPVHYKWDPIKTAKTSFLGTLNMLELAQRCKARFLISSTSEVYGDPLQHPQTEAYWGNVNCIGERSCYDEGKRIAETLTMDHWREYGTEVRIIRIFNTYGPRMALDDGRVVSNFVSQALTGKPMTVYGEGTQTRSFQYISDLIAGMVTVMEGPMIGPFNVGNPGEFTMIELAELVKEVVNPKATIVFQENTSDDPGKRKPDITKIKSALGWEPKVVLRDGLALMVEDFKKRLGV